jgi:hypothetical protein
MAGIAGDEPRATSICSPSRHVVPCDRAGVNETGPPLNDGHLPALLEDVQVLLLAEGGDDLVFLGNEVPHVEAQIASGKTRVARVAGIVEQPRRLDQVLGGQAAPVDARAPYRAHLGHDRPLAQLSRGDGGGKGCRATAQDHARSRVR